LREPVLAGGGRDDLLVDQERSDPQFLIEGTIVSAIAH
jgi:hypothetical protein